MYTPGKVSSVEAQRMIEQVVAEANKINKPVVVAVAGPEGELVAFLRMDGANAASGVIAQNKAYTSARDRKTTREMGQYMREKNSPPAFWGDIHITGFGGGVPIVQNNQVIGGIGVSGLSQDEDERIARAAIEVVYGK
ncbi:MAG: heme-binding protein [Cyclobacteriaceae bacterium]|nr:heme-binding protein [Cyclobacteriaceae bacterium]